METKKGTCRHCGAILERKRLLAKIDGYIRDITVAIQNAADERGHKSIEGLESVMIWAKSFAMDIEQDLCDTSSTSVSSTTESEDYD